MTELSILKKKTMSLLADYRNLKEQISTEKEHLKKEQEYLSYTEQAIDISQKVAQSVQQEVHYQISGIVSKCLETVFGEGYGFKILFERKRNRTEAVLTLLKEDREETDPLNEDSGGLIEVAAFALRVCCISLMKPKVRKLMILDEPFKSVHSLEYRNNVRNMLNQLATDFNLQIIMVTGVEEYKIGNIITME